MEIIEVKKIESPLRLFCEAEHLKLDSMRKAIYRAKKAGRDTIEVKGRRVAIKEFLRGDALKNTSPLLTRLLLAQKGRINVAAIYERLHLELDSEGVHSFLDFQKGKPYIPYIAIWRFVQKYIKAHPFEVTLIERGEDALHSARLPAIGTSNHAVTYVNEVVEIDASPLDAIIDIAALYPNADETELSAIQARYTLISLVDTYSGVASFYLGDTENAYSISRAIAKYISKFGKPVMIKGDNGRAFLSKYVQGVLKNLDIRYTNVLPYSGYLKPYVESNFRKLQNHLTAALSSYIGHSVSERQAIEFFYSRKDRRLKKGDKTNIKEILTYEKVVSLIDKYVDNIMLERPLKRLEGTISSKTGVSPHAVFNEAKDIVYMNDFVLTSLLAPRRVRKVTKKGITLRGSHYYNPAMFEYAEVEVAENINDTSRLFYFAGGKYKGELKELDSKEGVSVEVAKSARIAYKKRLKRAKDAIMSARELSSEAYLNLIEKANFSTKAASSEALPINSIDLMASYVELRANENKEEAEKRALRAATKSAKDTLKTASPPSGLALPSIALGANDGFAGVSEFAGANKLKEGLTFESFILKSEKASKNENKERE